MPIDNRSINEKLAEQVMAQQILKARASHCANCGAEVGYYRIAGLTIERDEMTWCDIICYEYYYDRIHGLS